MGDANDIFFKPRKVFGYLPVVPKVLNKYEAASYD